MDIKKLTSKYDNVIDVPMEDIKAGDELRHGRPALQTDDLQQIVKANPLDPDTGHWGLFKGVELLAEVFRQSNGQWYWRVVVGKYPENGMEPSRLTALEKAHVALMHAGIVDKKMIEDDAPTLPNKVFKYTDTDNNDAIAALLEAYAYDLQRGARICIPPEFLKKAAQLIRQKK